MAYDEGLAQRVREIIDERPDLEEKKMFGGVGFLIGGKMACGINQQHLIVRVGPAAYQGALSRPHTAEFDFTGRPMTGWIGVEPEGLAEDADLAAWVEQGVAFALTLGGE